MTDEETLEIKKAKLLLSKHGLETFLIDSEIKTVLSGLGRGCISEGLRILFYKHVSMRSPKIRNSIGGVQANKFINEYLVNTGNNKDVMTTKEIYDDYYEFSECAALLGKIKFNKMLTALGFIIRSGGQNITKVYGVKSNWLRERIEPLPVDGLSNVKEHFIGMFLEHSSNDLDCIEAKLLYEEYLEFESDTPLGKTKFYSLLRSCGFKTEPRSCNVIWVCNIKSNWL